MPDAPQSALQLTAACFSYDPYRRPTAAQALQAQFLTEPQNVPPEMSENSSEPKSEAKGNGNSKDSYTGTPRKDLSLSAVLDVDLSCPSPSFGFNSEDKEQKVSKQN